MIKCFGLCCVGLFYPSGHQSLVKGLFLVAGLGSLIDMKLPLLVYALGLCSTYVESQLLSPGQYWNNDLRRSHCLEQVLGRFF